MSKTATISAKLAVTGDGDTWSKSLPTMTNPTSPFEHIDIALSSGANTLTPPAGTTFAVIVPPTTSTVTKTLKGVTGDTGVPLAPAQPTTIPLASAAAFIITAGGAETIAVYWL